MKERFIPKKFSVDDQAMIAQINEILTEYEEQGYDLSLRQLYYQLVSRNLIENTEPSYKKLGKLVSEARYAGMVDWAMIVDRGRVMLKNNHWSSPAEIVKSAANQFRIDRWADQPTYVEVMVEKQALEGVLVPVCQELDVPFTSNKGYSSSSALYEASKRIIERAAGKVTAHIIYLGDHDPSGIDMSRDVLDRLQTFLQYEDVICDLERIALNMDQIREFNPPENPAKLTDSRSTDYIARFGRSSWELDAIEPRRLADLVRRAITRQLDGKLWKASGEKQQGMRDELLAFANDYERKSKRKKK